MLITDCKRVNLPLACECSERIQPDVQKIPDRHLMLHLDHVRSATRPDFPQTNPIGPITNRSPAPNHKITRVLPCNLDPRCERPEKRHFDVNLHEVVPAMRPQLVQAALTILRAFVATGRPNQNIEPYGRFEEWSDLVRAALVWAGCPDPCVSRVALEESDPIRAQLRGLLTSWYRIFGKMTITVQELIENAHDEKRADLYDALAAVAPGKQIGELNSVRLGLWLMKHAKRVQNDLRLEKMESRQNKNTFRVVSLKKSLASETPTAKAKAQDVYGGCGGCGGFPATPYEVSEIII